MKRITKRHLTAKVFHPNETDAQRPFSVTIRYLERHEREDHLLWLAEQEIAEGVINPQTQEPWRDEKGDPIIVRRARYGSDVTIQSLSLFVTGWSNLFDENDQPIPFSRENLIELTKEYLDVRRPMKVTKKNDADGTTEEVEIQQTVRFSQFLTEKLNEEGTFDKDPTVSGSATQ
jgi:hypothetical protein